MSWVEPLPIAYAAGVAHFALDTEAEALAEVRRLLSFLPSNNMIEAPLMDTLDNPDRHDPDLADIVPLEPNRSYDVRDIILRVVDEADFMEVHRGLRTQCGRRLRAAGPPYHWHSG